MLQRLRRFIYQPTSKNIVVNIFGTYLNVAFTAIFALILVRILTPAEYGVLSVLLGISYVLSNVLEFGTTATIYSTVPSLYIDNEKDLFRFIKSTFFFQSIFSLIVIATLIVFFPLLDNVFFKTKASDWVLTITAISVLLFIWQNFFTNILFAAKKFLRANLYINVANIVKTTALFVLAFTQNVTVGNVIIVFGILGPTVFFLFLLFKNREHISLLYNSPVRKDEFKFGYTITYFLASQFYNLGLRMDLFLLSYFGFQMSLGYYGLSQKIILSVITATISITQVLSPAFATIKSRKEAISQMKKGLLYMMLPSGVLILLILTPTVLFEVVFTKPYVPAAAITRLLAVPFILNAIGSVPMLFLLYTVKKPIYILISNIFIFFIVTIGSYLLIPKLNVFGPPIAILLAFVVGMMVQVIAVWKEYDKI